MGETGGKLPGISGTLPTTPYYENALNPPTSANCSGGNGQETQRIMGLMDAIKAGLVYLDSNVFIYALEGYQEYSKLLEPLLDSLDSGRNAAVTSELTLAEVLVKPMIMGDKALQSVYEETLSESDALSVVPVSREVLIEAARIRAEVQSIRLADAVHAATSRLRKAAVFVTNDSRLKALPGMKVVLLSDFKDSAE
jgi:predicted nucleic acid-binding protein